MPWQGRNPLCIGEGAAQKWSARAAAVCEDVDLISKDIPHHRHIRCNESCSPKHSQITDEVVWPIGYPDDAVVDEDTCLLHVATDRAEGGAGVDQRHVFEMLYEVFGVPVASHVTRNTKVL